MRFRQRIGRIIGRVFVVGLAIVTVAVAIAIVAAIARLAFTVIRSALGL